MSAIQTASSSKIFLDYTLRISILFILLLSIPLQGSFFQQLFSFNWKYAVVDTYNLVTTLPHYFSAFSSIADWLILLFIAVIGAYFWKQKQPDLALGKYYYLLRVFVRFRLASILFVAGFIKLFPSYAPELSLSHLNTGYGYFEHWKHLMLSLSAAPAYLIFLGVVELIAGVLLLNRKTSFLAVIFIIPFYGNVFLADLAYEGANYLIPVFIVLLTLPIFFYDVQRLGTLIVQLERTIPNISTNYWTDAKAQNYRRILKAAFTLFFVFFIGFKSYSLYKYSSLWYPEQAGLAQAAGKYLVKDYILNGDTIAYNPENKNRWNDVVFEKWNTLSVRTADSIRVQKQESPQLARVDSLRSYEYSQLGDRLYYRYNLTDADQQIVLVNPNKNYPGDTYRFHISRPDSSIIQLVGSNAKGDSLQINLLKVDKKYLLEEVKTIGRTRLGFKL